MQSRRRSSSAPGRSTHAPAWAATTSWFAHAPNLAFHALFDRSTNLTLARLQLQRLDLQLEDALQLR
jgi:hypothetical protein